MTQKEANKLFKKNRVNVDLLFQYVHVFFTKEDYNNALLWREGATHKTYIGVAYESILENNETNEESHLFMIGIFVNDSEVVVHECAHMARFLLNYIEQPLNDKHDEMMPYLVQYLYSQIIPMMKKHFEAV